MIVVLKPNYDLDPLLRSNGKLISCSFKPPLMRYFPSFFARPKKFGSIFAKISGLGTPSQIGKIWRKRCGWLQGYCGLEKSVFELKVA